MIHFATQESFVPRGIGADAIATIDGYAREDVDAYAMNHKKTTHARDNGYFDKFVPVLDKNGLTILNGMTLLNRYINGDFSD